MLHSTDAVLRRVLAHVSHLSYQPKKLLADTYYLANCSCTDDVSVLFRTVAGSSTTSGEEERKAAHPATWRSVSSGRASPGEGEDG